MNSVFTAVTGGFTKLFVDNLNSSITTTTRKAMADRLKDWLATTARVKLLSDVDERRRQMGARFDRLAETVRFEYEDGSVVVKATGEGEDTLKMLERGTVWFAPCDNVVNVLIPAMQES